MDLRKERLRGGPQACCDSSGKDVAAWCGYGASKAGCSEENLGETFQKKIHWVLQWGEVRQEQESRCGNLGQSPKLWLQLSYTAPLASVFRLQVVRSKLWCLSWLCQSSHSGNSLISSCADPEREVSCFLWAEADFGRTSGPGSSKVAEEL